MQHCRILMLSSSHQAVYGLDGIFLMVNVIRLHLVLELEQAVGETFHCITLIQMCAVLLIDN